MKSKDNTPIVIRGTFNGKTTYARIPIRNNYPLPNAETHPIDSLRMYLRYIGFILQHSENSGEEALKYTKEALEVFKSFEVVDTEVFESKDTL